MDLNLLTALDALLAEGSVAGAARRLGLSASAMSRTLARLRDATGDPLLVRAGRGLVPTPHAAALRERVRDVALEARAVLRPPASALDVARLERIFTLRSNEGFVDAFAARLVAAVTRAAPRVRLRFAPKLEKGARPLREGLVDLDIGVLGGTGPEMRVQALFDDHFVGVVRHGHPLASGDVTPERYAAHGHVVASRRGVLHGPVDDALAALGLARDVMLVVPGFPAALAVARGSDLVALVTHSYIAAEQDRLLQDRHMPDRETNTGGIGFAWFPLPVGTPPITISQVWHPRMDADPAHRWLRGVVHAVCRAARDPAPRA